MYKWVITHEIMPGKLPEVKKWLQGNYDKMRKNNPDYKGTADPSYKGMRQYITVYGSAYQYVAEMDVDDPTKAEPLAYAESTHNEGLIQFVVPGTTVVSLLKRLDFE